ncbi:DUF2007 domain-containing protein [Photobacterium sp. TY1-4]|nr:DUF2007 domain-containing protein [Photobacterium sp. TY1-4]
MAASWIRVYQATNNLEAHSLKGMLEHAQIEVALSGENLAAAAGELPADVLQVSLWVPAAQADRARALLKAYESAGEREWCCPTCGELNSGAFEICWQCGETQP